VRLTQTPRAALLLPILAALLLALPGASALSAESCEAPPGTSGSEQYCETLPAGGGDRQSTGGPGAARSFDRRTQAELGRSGRDGRGVLTLPAGGESRDPAPAGERSGSGRRSDSEPPGSPIGSLGSALESGSSAGAGFVWLLLGAGLAMAGIAWWRYRRAADA